MAFIVLLIFILFVGGMVFAVYKTVKKTDATMTGAVLKDEFVMTAQDFLPFNDIKDNIIDLGGHKYRAIVECSSTNYNLKTGKEKDIIEMSFQSFLNSLTFPITFYIQTKVIDDSKMLMQLEADLLETIEEYPQLEQYANVYFNEMKNLNTYIGNNKTKKKYIIIPFEETEDLIDLSDREKYEYSVKELSNRVNMIIEGLTTVGVKATLLDTHNLLELIYSIYHKDDYFNVEHLISGEFLETVVEGENKLQTLTDIERAEWILYEAQMRIKNEILSKALTEEEDALYGALIERLQEIRDTVEDVALKEIYGESKEEFKIM